MAVTVKRITLWRKELENKAGTLAGTLEPLAKVGADLQIVMGYRNPGDNTKAVVELYPVGLGTWHRASGCRGRRQYGFPGRASDRQKVLGGNRLRERRRCDQSQRPD